MSTTLLGRALPHPLITAPMAYMKLAHPDGEIGLARAAAATGTTFTLATLATTRQADLAAPPPRRPALVPALRVP